MNEPADPRYIEVLRRDREAMPPDDARARLASRLGVSDPLLAEPRRGDAPANAARGGVHTGSLLALAFVVGGAVGVALHAGLASAPEARVVYVERPAPAVPSVEPPAATTSAPNAADSAPPAAAIPSSVASPPHARLAQLDAERALLDAARVALVSGDSDTALRELDRHARTYAHPILGEERDALFVQTLVRAGRYDDARIRAEAFRRRAPQSLLLPAVDAAIASIP
jgi:hypothetical protein